MDDTNRHMACIAVDDEPRALELIRLHAGKVPFLNLARTFRDPLEAISWLNEQPVDLVFLDINMPHLSGIHFREMLERPPLIIFTTAYSEYAVESYEQQAVDYLVKPIRFERFLKAALHARERWQHKQTPAPKTPAEQAPASSHLFLKSGSKSYRLEVADILFLEKEGNYMWFHTKDQKVIARLSAQQALELLPGEAFLQVHRSYIVALGHIEMLEAHQVTVAGRAIPVAKAYRETLAERLCG